MRQMEKNLQDILMSDKIYHLSEKWRKVITFSAEIFLICFPSSRDFMKIVSINLHDIFNNTYLKLIIFLYNITTETLIK